MESPKIDKRSSNEIQEKIKKIIPYYLPQWIPKEGEIGWTIAQLFSEMEEDVLYRLNKVPENLFLDFLEKLGFKLLPAKPSKAPVVFEPIKNKKLNIHVKKGTKVSSKNGVIFETDEDFTVTSSRLNKIFSVNPNTDSIISHYNGKPSVLFQFYPQKHFFYAGDDYIFNLFKSKGKGLTLYMFPPFEADWEYFSGYDENENEIWKPFKKIEKITLRKPTEKELKKAKEILTKLKNINSISEGDQLLNNLKKLENSLIYTEKRYYKIEGEPIQKKEINGVKTFWIRTKLKNFLIKAKNEFSIYGISGIDTLFYNDIPLSIEDLLKNKEILPFGTEPKVGDTFYLASDEAFSKRNGNIKITFSFSSDSFFSKYLYKNEYKNTNISWEYWNGKSWKSLNPEITVFNKNKVEILQFLSPSDISKTEVNGEKHYWIRARITGLSYGNYEVVNNQVQPDFYPPKLKNIKIDFNLENSSPEYSFNYNNLEFEEVKEIIKNPYKPIPDENPSIYLGFDSDFGEGNINLFFSLKNPNWNESKYLIWKHWDGKIWKELSVKDKTQNLRESGIFQFISPKDIQKTIKFGEELYWLKLEIIEKYKPKKEEKKLEQSNSIKTETNRCIKTLNILENIFEADSKNEKITLYGIYPNTVYASQKETVKNEILGSSDGSPNQSFNLKHKPVIDVEIWVKEQIKPEDKSTKYFQEKNYFWVLWEEIDDLDFSCEKCRQYSVDRVSGEILFGNGINGKIPPKGKDNIKANYTTGGGIKGNLPVKEINRLVSSISYIDKVYNIEKASGGSEPENKNDILERVPKTLRHREKAINSFDFENLVKEASTNIAKLKIIPKLNNKGIYQTGWITVVIFPISEEKEPELSKGLIKNIENYMKQKLPITTKFQVIPPVYGKINVSLTIFIKDFSKFSKVKDSVKQKLEQFLNPITGNINGNGWEFGEIPCFSDFFTVINSVEEIENIENLHIFLKVKNNTFSITSDETSQIKAPPHLLIVPGEIEIEIKGAENVYT